MLLYLLAGYVLYGLILVSIDYARGSFDGASTSFALLGAFIYRPLSANMLTPAYWGNIAWSSAFLGIIKLIAKVLILALIAYFVVSQASALLGFS